MAAFSTAASIESTRRDSKCVPSLRSLPYAVIERGFWKPSKLSNLDTSDQAPPSNALIPDVRAGAPAHSESRLIPHPRERAHTTWGLVRQLTRAQEGEGHGARGGRCGAAMVGGSDETCSL